ncbi:carboxyl-terminal-processing peptidase 1, chloroplastic [Tanacetum coccineum]
MDNGKTSVGYVRLKEFNALARKDLVTAMKRLQGMGASVFVLDLRDNLGGLVQEGIEIAKLFLNKGETVNKSSDVLNDVVGGYSNDGDIGISKL